MATGRSVTKGRRAAPNPVPAASVNGEGRELLHAMSNALGAARLHLLALRRTRDEAERAKMLDAADASTALSAAILDRLRTFLDGLDPAPTDPPPPQG